MQLQLMVAVLSTVALATSFEPDGFDAIQALRDRGLDAAVLNRLSTLNGQCSCSDACSALSSHYGADHVLIPNGTAYTTFREGYWSAIQSDVYPQCIFEPPDAAAVSVLVLLSRSTQCPFAVKSGGHSAFSGAASIEGGITVSLQNLNNIDLSDDKKIAAVGAGNDWAQVYTKLAEDEVTATGGRVARIGVGGLTLGGGISFFSGFHGWACDNVEAYEIVTASGELITATPTDYPDLYWALRGGGNNFGIVTNFHLRTVPIPGNVIWGGARTYLETDFPAVIQAFTDLSYAATSDPNAGQWTAFGSVNGTKFGASTLWYANPSNISTTTVFDTFNAIKPLTDDTKVRDLTNFTLEIQKSNPYGFREVYWCMTTKASVEIATFAVDTFFTDYASSTMAGGPLSNVTGVLPILLFQSIAVPQITSMAQNNGNPLGLNPSDGPLFLIAFPSWWQDAKDDETVYAFIAALQGKIQKKAVELGVANNYIYMNYASRYQDVIASYGTVNKLRLMQVAREYDPQGVFQTLQPGYFKLAGPPVSSVPVFTGE